MSILSDITNLAIGFITINSRMGKQEQRVEKIEKNYLDRFDSVNERIHKSETIIIDRINAMHMEVIDRINEKR